MDEVHGVTRLAQRAKCAWPCALHHPEFPELAGKSRWRPVLWLMLVAFVNPHRFGLAGAFEANRTVEIDRATIGRKNHLVEPCVLSKKGLHHFAADAMPMKVRMNEHVGKIYDEMPVGNCIPKTD